MPKAPNAQPVPFAVVLTASQAAALARAEALAAELAELVAALPERSISTPPVAAATPPARARPAHEAAETLSPGELRAAFAAATAAPPRRRPRWARDLLD